MLQIIGTKKCPETRKALRFCKERSIGHQFVDLHERELSEGEWQKIFLAIHPETLVDKDSAYFAKEGYLWREYDAQEELQAHPQLLKTPLLKMGNKVIPGCDTVFMQAVQERT